MTTTRFSIKSSAHPLPQDLNLVFVPALFVVMFSLYALQWPYSLSNGFNNLVGGVSTVGAERVLGGEMPYRDFWTMYAPGQFYLLALLFWLFGAQLWVEVVAAGATCAAAACVCYLVTNQLSRQRLLALAGAAIYVAATYDTQYYRRLGSYPPAVFFLLLSLLFVIIYYQTYKLRYLIYAGLATGMVAVFKHDVGAYTSIAISAGMLAHGISVPATTASRVRSILIQLAAYGSMMLVIIIPIIAYFGWIAGPAMWQALIVFPLTDFRFARPESYPSLWPTALLTASSRFALLTHTATYLIFTIPFLLQMLGLVTIAVAVWKRQQFFIAIGVTAWIGFWLHYSAAHIQINTHIITLSVYAAITGALFYAAILAKIPRIPSALITLLVSGLVVGWLLALMAKPLYTAWWNRGYATATINLAKVAGFRVSPDELNHLLDLTEYVQNHINPNQAVYVGLHRHDVIVIGDILIYFILNRPIATYYHELHPAMTDTVDTQQTIINELKIKDVPLIIRKNIFSDKTLEAVKADFLRELPQIGATDLDLFIDEHYRQVQRFGPYSVWERIEVVRLSVDRNARREHSLVRTGAHWARR